MSHYLPSSIAGAIPVLLRVGLPMRAVARRLDVSPNTVSLYAAQLPPMICPCGKASNHRAWCHLRVSMSPGRQKFLRSWRPITNKTEELWTKMRDSVEFAAANAYQLCSIDKDAQASLRSFYNPTPDFSFEWDGGPKIVAITEPSQELSDPILLRQLSKLSGRERKLVTAILDSESLDQAAEDADIGQEELPVILESLRQFLGPILGRTAPPAPPTTAEGEK